MALQDPLDEIDGRRIRFLRKCIIINETLYSHLVPHGAGPSCPRGGRARCWCWPRPARQARTAAVRPCGQNSLRPWTPSSAWLLAMRAADAVHLLRRVAACGRLSSCWPDDARQYYTALSPPFVAGCRHGMPSMGIVAFLGATHSMIVLAGYPGQA